MKIRVLIIQKLIHLIELVFFYPKVKRFFLKEFDTDIINIVDVGSNKGQTIDFFLSLRKKTKIIAFEPNPNLVKGLERKYKNKQGIIINAHGVSNVKGRLLFHENILDETSTFETVNHQSSYLISKNKILGVKDSIVKSYEISVICLADVLKDLYYDVLKIDVEGHELQVLQGLFKHPFKSYITYIQIESHEDDMYLSANNKNKIKDIFRLNGFEKIIEFNHPFGNFTDIIYKNTNEA
jgi:FkbM family methyltransferase